MTQKVLIIGGVGSGTVIAQAIKDATLKGFREFELEGFMNDRAEEGDYIEGIPVIAKQNKENIKLYMDKGYKFIYSLHHTEREDKFVNLFDEYGLSAEVLATFVHPKAYVAPDVTIKAGSVIMPYVMISSHAIIGLNSLIMTGATIGHNTSLGKFNHIASQAVVGAHIKMGIGVNIGLNATVREYLTLGNYATLGMGGVLTKNVGDEEIWVGNPAKFLRKIRN